MHLLVGQVLPRWNHPMHCRGFSASDPSNDNDTVPSIPRAERTVSTGIPCVLRFHSLCRRRISEGTAEANQTKDGWGQGPGSQRTWEQGILRLQPVCGRKRKSWDRGGCLGALNEDGGAVRELASQNRQVGAWTEVKRVQKGQRKSREWGKA